MMIKAVLAVFAAVFLSAVYTFAIYGAGHYFGAW